MGQLGGFPLDGGGGLRYFGIMVVRFCPRYRRYGRRRARFRCGQNSTGSPAFYHDQRVSNLLTQKPGLLTFGPLGGFLFGTVPFARLI